MWAQENDTQASVDEGWEAAKAQKETELLIEKYGSALKDLDDAMDSTLDYLAQLTEGFAALSRLGRFSAPMEKAIWLLEHRYTDMERKGVRKEQLDRMHDRLELMKRKLELVRNAEEKALKEM